MRAPLERSEGRVRAVAVVASVAILGQAILLLLGPLSRASGTFAQDTGIAILVPDSRFYLRPSGLSEVFALPWTRWGYPLLVSVGGGRLDLGTTAVIVNSLVLLAAAYLMFRVVDAQAGTVAATAAVSILLLNPMTAQWLRIVMTESVFFGMVVAATALGHLALAGGLRRFGTLAVLALAILATVTRPNGFLVAASLIALLIIGRTEGRRRVVLVSAVWFVALLVLPVASASTGQPAEGTLTSQLYAGVIIEGTDRVRTVTTMPAPRDATDESIRAAARYVAAHPIASARLGVSRLTMETLQVRRHYPMVVNVGFGGAMLAFLSAAAIGWRDPRSRSARTVFVTLAVPLMLLTMATFAVPEGRYGWAYLLPLAPIAGVGVDRALARLAPRTHRKLVAPSTAS